jgi:hypothetical protein
MKDSLSWHEALDRTYLVSEMFGQFLVEHPIIQANDQLRTLAEEIGGKLGELYHLIGTLDPEDQRLLELRRAEKG